MPGRTLCRAACSRDEHLYAVRGGHLAEGSDPDRRAMALGQERFNVFFAPCTASPRWHRLIVHARLPTVRRVIRERLVTRRRVPVRRHDERVRRDADYSAQVPVADRWAIAA